MTTDITISQPAIAQTFTDRGEAHEMIDELDGEITIEVNGERSIVTNRRHGHAELERLCKEGE